jgi:hypothetical protein
MVASRKSIEDFQVEEKIDRNCGCLSVVTLNNYYSIGNKIMRAIYLYKNCRILNKISSTKEHVNRPICFAIHALFTSIQRHRSKLTYLYFSLFSVQAQSGGEGVDAAAGEGTDAAAGSGSNAPPADQRSQLHKIFSFIHPAF